MRIPRLLIAGTHSGAGKTSLSAALMAAFTAAGCRVLPFKAGPDYIDPAFHTAVTGNASRNLDSWLLPKSTILELFCRAAARENRQAGAVAGEMAAQRAATKLSTLPSTMPASGTLALIEGVMGLFDGQGTGHEGSSAHLAQILNAPIILVIDAKGLSRSAAALARGYASFFPDVKISGIICNRVSGARHYALLKSVIEEQAGIPCFGFLPANPEFSLKSRHLGLIPAEEVTDLQERLAALTRAAQEHIDLPGLLDLAKNAPDLPGPQPVTEDTRAIPDAPALAFAAPVRIGIARDEAFSFYYQDNLDLLEELGAVLVPFSPLRDLGLPKGLHGLYIGGGFPEEFAAILEANSSMQDSVKKALEGGLPCYAECGGLLYLTRSISLPFSPESGNSRETRSAEKQPAHKAYTMVGFFSCRSIMEKKLQPFGYVSVALRHDSPLGPAGTSFRAHEFHHSRLEWDDIPQAERAAAFADGTTFPSYSARKPDGALWDGGLLRGETLAVYPHLHFHSRPETARSFIAACRRTAERTGGKQ